jgi:hypothetical protein
MSGVKLLIFSQRCILNSMSVNSAIRGWERVMLGQVSICLDLGTELLPIRKDRPGNRWRHLAS